MNVLVACEFSGTVREAFNAYSGVHAVSNDILPCSDGRPDFHIQGDCFDAIESRFWDLIIIHPPCTALCLSGNRHYGNGCHLNYKRHESKEWTARLWGTAKRHSKACALENPKGVLSSVIGKYSQVIHPWQFGHPEQKETCLWLNNLPALEPTNDVYERMMTLPRNQRERLHFLPPSKDRWAIRSTTFPGIASAMAALWIPHVLSLS